MSGNSYALESFETTFNQDLNGDSVIGPTTRVIQTDTNSFGTTTLTEVASQYFYLDGSGGSGPALQYAGANVTAGEFGGWTPIGAVQTASGYEVAWKVAGANEYTVWTTDSHGNYTGNLIGAVSGNSYALELFETTFNQDLNGDTVIGPTTRVIQTDTNSFGTTTLTEVANQYFYLDGSGGSGPALQYAGANVTAAEFGGWTPIGAAQTASGYEVAWKVAGANEYTVWTTDSHGNYTGNLIGAVSGNSYALELFETTFNQDLNGDTVIGPTTRVIQTDTNSFGTTTLTEVASQYFYLDGSGGSGPALQYAGANVTAGEFGGWTPIGAVQTASGYEVAWKVAGANEYTVWTTDSHGNYTGNLIGAVSGNSYALESFETTFNQDLNGDTVIGPTTRVIQTDTNSFGTTTLTEVANQYFYLDGSGGSGPALQYAGANVTAAEFGGWTPIGAAQTASGYEVAWKVAGANEYTVWTTDSHGNYTGNLIGAVSGNSYALESFETTFNQDLNGDRVIGPTTRVIQTDTNSFGSTSLTEVASQYFYLDGSGGSGPALQYAGANVTAGEFGGWTPIGAAQTTSGYEVAWKVAGANEYTVWTTDSHGNYSGNLIGAVSGNSYALESLETTFNQDLNGDGVIGPTTTVIQTDTNSFGSTSLTEVASQYFDLDGSGGSGPALQYAGANVTAGEFGGWTPIGAVQTASGYEVAWKVAGANEYTVWTTDSHGNYSGNLIGAVSGNSYALESLETTFNQDLNGDGVIGPTKTVIQTDTTSFGSTSLTEVASQYFDLDGSGGSGPALQYAGANVTAGEFGGWTPIGAVQTTSGYEVAWKVAGANEYTIWTTDSHGNYSGNLIGAVSGNSYALESLETTFNQDLNGDAVIGLYATPATTEQISQPLAGASGVATIGASATLELTAADSASVTFAAPTGMLKLDQPSTFTGEIFNFTGNGSLSGSDQIDLRTINYNSVHDSYGTGVLTVTDGTNIANLHFSGSYTLANFKFASDGSGGTIVYDPPVLNSPTAGTRIVTADHRNDAFLFHTNLSQTASTEHTFRTDTVHVGQAEFAWASLAIVHDAHEDVIFPNALHDMHNNALAQQHHSGFLI